MALILVGIAGLGALSAIGAPPQDLHFIFDLSTLVRPVTRTEPITAWTTQEIIPKDGTLAGQKYRVIEGAPELVGSLLKDYPSAKLSFLGEDSKEQIMALLGELKLPDGKSFIELSPTVFGKESLTPTVIPSKTTTPNAYRPFNVRKQKWDLSQILSTQSQLDNTILISSDQSRVLLDSTQQEKNFLWLGPSPKIYKDTLLARPGMNRSEMTQSEFFQERNKLARARGLIDYTISLQKKAGRPLRDLLWERQWATNAKGGLFYRTASFSDLKYYQMGRDKFKMVNPNYRLIPISHPAKLPLGCTRKWLSEFAREK